MRVFKIVKEGFNTDKWPFITKDVEDLKIPLNCLMFGEKLTITAEKMTEEEYNNLHASVESCKFFGQWDKE